MLDLSSSYLKISCGFCKGSIEIRRLGDEEKNESF
jgi:hypothetical protein